MSDKETKPIEAPSVAQMVNALDDYVKNMRKPETPTRLIVTLTVEGPDRDVQQNHDALIRFIEAEEAMRDDTFNISVKWHETLPTPPPPSETAEGIAKRFHNAYERLAPNFGYTTRKASAVPWEQVPENNRNLMIAVCSEVFPISPPPSETAMTDRRICPTCCHFRDADVPCSDAFHIAPPSETKLSEALDEFATANQNYRDCELDPQKANGELESFQDEINAARSSLESLYREQMLEIARLREEREVESRRVEEWIEREAKLCPEDFGIEEYVAALLKQLSALRSLQLTQEEAQMILDSQPMITSATREKLRISSKATSEEL